jgi:filamentous hemagglutinin family protein
MHSHSRASRALLLASAAVFSLPGVAFANPLGAAVTSGTATVSHPSSSNTTVKQTSEGVVIDWSSFNVGAGQTTQFVQPNASAIAVNRIGGKNGSEIMGTLDANGRIVLINGNGVLFGKGAQVNVGSLIATSTDGSDSAVLSGKFTNAGNPNAKVVNQGQIVVGTSGVVALVAPSVTNTGIVNAKLGTVALGAANKFTVDFAGDGLVSFAAQGDVNAKASASNMGTLSGANISLTAHAAEGLATGVVNMSGTIAAQGARNVGGTILLDAGNGTLTTTGTLNAAGATGGGNIETSGRAVDIAGHVTAGEGGHWKVDPTDLTIDSAAAATIDGSLNGGTDVSEQTTAGPGTGAGDITVASGLSWSTTNTLTLDAWHSLNIDAPIAITGAGNLALQYNDAGSDGTMNFSFLNGGSGHVEFDDVLGGLTQGSLKVNGTSYQLVNSISQLASTFGGTPSAKVALANSYNASADGPYSSVPVFELGTGGSLEGLGNVISNLTVNNASGNAGLFHLSLSTIRDIGIEGSFSGTNNVGALVDANYGTIINSFATASITETTAGYAGVLVAFNAGSISNSHSAGSITATASNTYLGGLAGDNGAVVSISFSTATVTSNLGTAMGGLVGLNGTGGAISNSYATGSVTGVNESGGLVGQNMASIDNSYATGALTGSASFTGGVVGASLFGSSYTADYWDTGTSGITNTAQGTGNKPNVAGITGSSTANLQAALDGTWSTGTWGIVAGKSYPYLLWQSPNGAPQVISGLVTAADGVTAQAGQTVAALIDGAQVSALVDMNSGANGYYYMLLAPGTISQSNGDVLAYLTGATPGNAYTSAINSVTGFNIAENTLRVRSGASDTNALFYGMASALGKESGSDFLYSYGVAAVFDRLFPSKIFNLDFTSGISLTINDSASAFAIDNAINIGSGILALNSAGAITETSSITAGVFKGKSTGGATLDDSSNEIAAMGAFTNTGAGGFSLTDGETLKVSHGAIAAGTGDLSLTTLTGDIDLLYGISAGGTVTLTSAGSIWEKPAPHTGGHLRPASTSHSGTITAYTLTGSAAGFVVLSGANEIANLGDFTDTGGRFVLNNSEGLTVSGTVNTGSNILSLQASDGDLVVNGALSGGAMTLRSLLGQVYGTGQLTANSLIVTADTGIDLNGGSNLLGTIYKKTASGTDIVDTN